MSQIGLSVQQAQETVSIGHTEITSTSKTRSQILHLYYNQTYAIWHPYTHLAKSQIAMGAIEFLTFSHAQHHMFSMTLQHSSKALWWTCRLFPKHQQRQSPNQAQLWQNPLQWSRVYATKHMHLWEVNKTRMELHTVQEHSSGTAIRSIFSWRFNCNKVFQTQISITLLRRFICRQLEME